MKVSKSDHEYEITLGRGNDGWPQIMLSLHSPAIVPMRTE
jgi:hypothetical protein